MVQDLCLADPQDPLNPQEARIEDEECEQDPVGT